MYHRRRLFIPIFLSQRPLVLYTRPFCFTVVVLVPFSPLPYEKSSVPSRGSRASRSTQVTLFVLRAHTDASRMLRKNGSTEVSESEFGGRREEECARSIIVWCLMMMVAWCKDVVGSYARTERDFCIIARLAGLPREVGEEDRKAKHTLLLLFCFFFQLLVVSFCSISGFLYA